MGRFYLSDINKGHLLSMTLFYQDSLSGNWSEYLYLDLDDTDNNRRVAENWRDEIIEAIARVHRINPNNFTDYKEPFNPIHIIR